MIQYKDLKGELLKKFDKHKGVAGLDLFIEVIVTLFVIGILIMAFTLAASEMQGTITDNTSIQVINNTKTALSSAVDWFDTFIVIAAIVVLILMIILIVRAVRASGMMGPGGGA